MLTRLPQDLVQLVPAPLARRYGIVPLVKQAGKLTLACKRPLDAEVLEEIRFALGCEVKCRFLSADEIDPLLDKHFGGAESTSPATPSYLEKLTSAGGQNGESAQYPFGEGPVKGQVRQMIQRAIEMGASDIHVEPYESTVRVRFRLDGVLKTLGELPLSRKNEVVSRIKILAELDIAEKRRPQDGRIRTRTEEDAVDLRISTLPTAFGEKIVLRVLDRRDVSLELGSLGMEPRQLEDLRWALRRPRGLVLVTGPTGSGKTTTLYAALNELNREGVNVTTIEDPIEYNLAGINQAQVKSDIGFTFAEALRAFLRQDPDVIMVGEIRDKETAQIAVRAALTGHLVLSTLHTNDAPSTTGRLLDMEVPPYLLASSLRMVVAQRLVRKICPQCLSESALDPALRQDLGLDIQKAAGGEGCDTCHETGFQGRTALFEMMSVTPPLREKIAQGARSQELRRIARGEGMASLKEVARRLVTEKVTTLEEALRATA